MIPASLLLALCATIALAEPPVPPDHPNILLVLSDDQRAETIAALGNPVIRTPAIDALARRGTVWTSAYGMGSRHPAVCLPSRGMIMSGRSLFQVDDWAAARSSEEIPLVPEGFRAAGYETFITGKWHGGELWLQRAFESGRSVFLGGMGSHRSLRVWDFDAGEEKRSRTIASYSSQEFADRAVAWLETRDRTRPFFLHLSFTAPHDPRTPPASLEAAYDPSSVPLPGNFLPAHPFDNGEMTVRDEELLPRPRAEADVRREIACYYAMIEHLDAQLGRVLEAIERLGEAARTIVVFASDNGLAIGSHGLLGKQNLYEHSVRVPLIIAGPGVPAGARRDELVYLHDIGPTLCALAAVPPPPEIDGRSLLDPTRPPRTGILLAYRNVQRAYRTERWKIIRYPRIDRTQLFDLAADPEERNDLAQDPGHALRVAEMLRLLELAQRAAGDDLPVGR